MAVRDRRKQSLYFSEGMLDELRFEAGRLDRSVSWLVQKAWKMAREQLMTIPSANEAPAGGGSSETDGDDTDPTVTR